MSSITVITTNGLPPASGRGRSAGSSGKRRGSVGNISGHPRPASGILGYRQCFRRQLLYFYSL